MNSTMKTTISNEKITFAAESLGAEPWILKFNDDEVNYIWRPSPDRSGGTPLCFPLLGAVPEGKYHLDGHEYRMDMHGFAQNCEFTVAEKTGDSAVYEIHESPETLVVYPYRFRFQVLYALEGTSLKTEYRIKNNDDKEIYFSVGGHPRFSCPMDGTVKENFSDYFLKFEKPELPEDIVKSYGLRETIEKFMSADNLSIALDYRIFEKGCFCLSRAHDRLVSLRSKKSSRALQMRIKGDAYLQVWTAAGSPFVALEPWYGSMSSLSANLPVDGDWKGRPGTLHISPGEEYRCSHSVTIVRDV